MVEGMLSPGVRRAASSRGYGPANATLEECPAALTASATRHLNKTSASMVTPEKPPGKARNASGRVETSLDDYGIPRDCVVGSPPSRLEDTPDFTNTFNSPDTVQ